MRLQRTELNRLLPFFLIAKMTTTTNGIDEGLASAFRQHLPDLTSPRFTTSAQQSPYEYSGAFQKTGHPPWLYKLTKAWEQLLEEPFQGVTTDGMRPAPENVQKLTLRQAKFATMSSEKKTSQALRLTKL